jgi:murein peptide amidase A
MIVADNTPPQRIDVAPAARKTSSVLHYGDHLAARHSLIETMHVQEAPEGRSLARYRWADPLATTKPPYRIGIFAGIHGDEQAGVIASVQLLHHLALEPHLGRFLEIFFYPVCNPWGFDAGCREGESGKDLNRCFWAEREEPEVRLIEQELRSKCFDGIIALHTDDTSEGIYGYVNGSTLTRHLLEPSLRAASAILPRDVRPEIDTHPAEHSIITGGYRGILGAPPDQHPKPFEIVFETPHLAPLGLQVDAHLAALKEILRLFPQISSQGMDI